MRALWATLKSLLQHIKDRYLTRQPTQQYHSEPTAILIQVQDATLIQTDIDFSTERVI
jgi:hypothetical protein